MSEINKNDLLKYLQTHNDPTVDTAELHAAVNRYLGSNLVSQAIEGAIRLSPFFSSATSDRYLDSICVEEYLSTCVPRLSFGRQFGHSIGLVKYLISNACKKTCLVITPTEHMSKELNSNVESYTNFSIGIKDVADIAAASMPAFKPVILGLDFKRYGAIIIDEYSFLTDEQIELIATMSFKHRIPLLFLGTVKK